MEYFGILSELCFSSCFLSGGLVSYKIYEKRTSFSPDVSLGKDDYMGTNKYVLALSGTTRMADNGNHAVAASFCFNSAGF